MGAVCCTPEISLSGKRMKNRHEIIDIFNSTAEDSMRDSKSSYENSIRRLNWFEDQYKDSRDAEFFTKEINLCDFDVKYMIGKGFYSKVFLVTKVDTNEPFAMKVIKKSQLKNEESKAKIITEKQIMRMCDSPFIAKLHYAFQTSTKFYFILDFVNGGELQSKLMEKYKFNEELTKFYGCEILMALKCLHEQNILYRDLKPKNILVDSEGHIKLIDFGLSKLNWEAKDSRKVVCGTPHYVAPEILLGKEHTTSMDFWSLGVVLYEMLHGYYPFVNGSLKSAEDIFECIVKNPLKISNKLSKNAKSLLESLLEKDPEKRLGHGGISEVLSHPFFNEIDWTVAEERKLTPPYIPKVKNKYDIKYIDDQFLEQDIESSCECSMAFNREAKEFRYIKEFSYTKDKIQEELSELETGESRDSKDEIDLHITTHEEN